MSQRPVRKGSVHDVIAQAVDAVGAAQVAADLAVSRGQVSKYSDPDEENGRRMAVAQLHQLCRMHPEDAGPVVARHFAGLAGCMFVPLPEATSGEVAEAAAALVARTSETMCETISALGSGSKLPGDLTPEEARRVMARLEEDIDAAATLMALCRARLGDQP